MVELLEAAVIGTGWCGGIRAETLSRSALCKKLHVCEIRPDRLAEVKALTNPATATLDYRDVIANENISVVYICTTPENTHFPITRDCLRAGKHVLLEKPIAMELFEADELIALAKRAGVKFTIGYSQRFNTKIAYAKKKIADGTLGRPVSLMVSRHLSRSLGKRIAGRTRLSPAAMESTHDLDFAFWLLENALAVSAHLARRNRAGRPIALRPLHNRRHRNPKPCRNRPCAFPTENRSHHTFTKIVRQRSAHQMLASTPASILNHTAPQRGIPPDSINT